MEEVRTIYVSNVSPYASEEDIQNLFEPCGTITAVILLSSSPGVPQYAYVQFSNSFEARTATALSDSELLGLPLKIVLASSNDIPNLQGPTSPGILPIPLMANTSSIFPATSASGITAISNAQKAEEVARTVYVGNVNSQISTEQLINFFARCGPITYCRMAGDESHPSRFAFIEFATLTGAQSAMLLNWTTLLDRPIKVNHSKNPIVKPPKAVESSVEEEAVRAVKKAAAAITARLMGQEKSSKSSRSRSRSRSGSRSRRRSGSRSRSSSHRRHRRRSPSRSRSRSKSRSPSDSRSRSRSRSSRRRGDRHRRSSRDRDRGRDRSYGHRRSSRDRDSKRKRSRSRERKREGSNERGSQEQDGGEQAPKRLKSTVDKGREKGAEDQQRGAAPHDEHQIDARQNGDPRGKDREEVESQD